MAAMAQLDCGACGYLCQTYSEAIARGEEKDLTKCSPGGKDTAKKLKELVAAHKSLLASESNGGHTSGGNGVTALTEPARSLKAVQASLTRVRPDASLSGKLLECRPLTRPGSEKDVRHVVIACRGAGLTLRAGRRPRTVFPRTVPNWSRRSCSRWVRRGDELVPTSAGRGCHPRGSGQTLRHHDAADALASAAGHERHRPFEARHVADAGPDDEDEWHSR